MKCLECNIETENPKFCSKSCSAKFNNKKFPKRKTNKTQTYFNDPWDNYSGTHFGY